MIPAQFFNPFASELPILYSILDDVEFPAQLKEKALYLSQSTREKMLGTGFWAPSIEQVRNLANTLPKNLSKPQPGGNATQILSLMPQGIETEVLGLIETLHPWRKGPFQFGGVTVDSEWQSWMKWDRLKNHIPDLTNKVALDIGCNNGYYLFRLLEKNPKALVGMDPNDRFMLQFFFLRLLSGHQNMLYEPLGVDDLALFPKAFDLILCLGVIYHRQNPLGMLQTIRESLRSDGMAIIESITIPEDYARMDTCLFVNNRYAQMRNVYFIPTPTVLADWMRKSGFSKVEIIDETETTIEEQRKTPFARFASLEDFLDPNDKTKTVEGYPMPRRTIVSGRI